MYTEVFHQTVKLMKSIIGSFSTFSKIQNTQSLFDGGAIEVFAPLLYVQGSDDPITPVSRAFNAFLRTPTKEKYFMEIPNYSHSWIYDSECTTPFWKEMEREGVSFSKAVEKLRKCTILRDAHVLKN